MKIIGWKVVGDHHPEVPKRILIAGPHTSNWDFPLGLMTRSIIQDDIKYVGKASLFKPPLGWIMKKLGGVGVDRTKSNNFVDAVVQEFSKHDRLAILFAPEGSRKKVEKFKTGFYHIARQAKIPILPAVLDYRDKEFKFLPLFWATGDEKKDLQYIENLYKGVAGYHPEKGF